MDWTSIIIALLGGTTVGGVFEAVRWRKENKRMKENEVRQADVAAQTAHIDYADRYFNGMLELLEKVKHSQDNASTNQGAMLDKLDILDERTRRLTEHDERQDVLLTDIVAFLNGDFQKYLNANHKTREDE